MPTDARYAILLDEAARASGRLLEALRGHPLLDATWVVRDAATLFERVGRSGPAALVVVAACRDPDGAARIADEVRRAWPATAVIALVAGPHARHEARLRERGVRAFVTTEDPPDLLTHAISVALAGPTDLGSSPHGVPGAIEPAVTASELGLSPRQSEVLWFIVHGAPNKLIARRLALSEATVKEHVSAVLQRLAVGSRVGAVVRLRGRRLVVPGLTARHRPRADAPRG
jgi:DNA-binding NarL/FixJ family response regulator